jgi:hypothetical protein
MLHAIFEEADLQAKVSTSLASGDWSNWSAGELDELVKEGEQADSLIGKIVKSDKEFPDNLWEAVNRKYSVEELSGSIKHYMVDEENGKIHLHQSLIDRLTERDKQWLVRDLNPLIRDRNPVRFTGSRDAGNLKYVPWDTTEIEKAKQFHERLQAVKRSAAAQKGLLTKKEKKENETKEGGEGLKPTMTEHWHRWMPDDVPTGDISWERLRGLLKTKSKLDIDLMLREMEKVGVVTASEHGSKVFRGAKYHEIMGEKKDRFAHSHIKDYNGTYSNAQMIRGRSANPALVSVGMPLNVENRWKKEHPKLHAFLKRVRTGNHKSVYKGIRPFGWVRIDKLSLEDWLIEEIQQDVSKVEREAVGNSVYGAKDPAKETKRHADDLAENQQALALLPAAQEAAKKYIARLRQVRPEWDKWELKNRQSAATVAFVHSAEERNASVLHNGKLPYVDEMAQMESALSDTLSNVGIHFNYATAANPDSFEQDLFGADGDFERREKEIQRNIQIATDDHGKAKQQLDSGVEPPEMSAWKTDITAVKEIVGKFPRWAMHAVKMAAKEHGVKRLWWVTYNQKKLRDADPPRSFTSDQLARKYGFKKVALEKDPTYSSPCYPLVGTGIIEPILKGPEETHWEQARPDGTTVPSDELNKPEPVDQFLWMAPVSDIVTEQALDLGVFG